MNIQPEPAIRGVIRFLNQGAALSNRNLIFAFLPFLISDENVLGQPLQDAHLFNLDADSLLILMHLLQPLEKSLPPDDLTIWCNDLEIGGQGGF